MAPRFQRCGERVVFRSASTGFGKTLIRAGFGKGTTSVVPQMLQDLRRL